MINVEQYQPAMKSEVIELIQQGGYKADIWDWQFGLSNQYPPIVAKAGMKTVGFNGTMEIAIWCDGEEQEGIWSCDFYVAKQVRGQGVGKSIKDALIELGPRFIMSLGISDAAHQLLLTKGWRSINGVRVYRKRVNPKGLAQLPYLAAQTFNKLRFLNVKSAKVNVEFVGKLPHANELDVLWQKNKSGYRACVVRNAEYLNWRYALHPLGHYKFALAKDDLGLVAILIYKLEKSTLRVVDYIGPAQAYLVKKSLLNILIKNMRQDIKNVNFTTSDQEWRKVLYASGFYCSRQHERFVVLDKGSNAPNAVWYITGGDSDGDIIQTAVYSMMHKTQELKNDQL